MTAVLALLLGATLWTFTEYAMHYWIGHLTRGKTTFSKEHLAHHADATYFATTLKKVYMAAPVLAVVGLASVQVAGVLHGSAFTLGFLATYVAYEVLHRRIHTHAPVGDNLYGRWARRHHLHHHHRNPNANHGVTTPIWDVVFRTYEAPVRLRIPRRKAPVWLFDEAGGVKTSYQDHYQLAGRG